MASFLVSSVAQAADLAVALAKRGLPIVQVAINDKGPFPMVLDTAAGLSTVTTALKDELGLAYVGRMPQPIQLAGGTEPIDLYTMGTVSLAGEKAPAPVTVILDAPLKYVPEARGILGMNVLSRFAVDLDQPNRRLIIRENGALPDSGADWSKVKVDKRWDSFLIVDTLVDGVKAKAVIDTGANRTILNAALASKLGIVAGAEGVEEGKINSAGTASLKAQIDLIKLGDTRWDAVDIQAADLPLFKALGIGDGPALVLGNDVLSQVRLFIDYENDTVYLTRPSAGAVVGEDNPR